MSTAVASLSVQMGDIELVRAFQDGSVEAFDELFLRYHVAIQGLTNRLLRDPLLAEDLTQETFFRVLRSLNRVDDSFNFSAWIHRIATNLCYDELRRRKRGLPPAGEEGPRATSIVVGIEDPDEVLATIASKDPSGHPGGRPGDAGAPARGLGRCRSPSRELPDCPQPT